MIITQEHVDAAYDRYIGRVDMGDYHTANDLYMYYTHLAERVGEEDDSEEE